MPRKNENVGEERTPKDLLIEAIKALPREDKMELSLLSAELASEDRKSAKDPYAHKKFGTSRDSGVQRMAALWLHEKHAMKGISFREIAAMVDLSYERVRQLYNKFYPEAARTSAEEEGEHAQKEKSA